MANKKSRKRKALKWVTRAGNTEELWLVSDWRAMPDIKRMRSAFVVPFYQEQLVFVRVDSAERKRYTLPGGKKERGERTIEVVVRRECYEEAYATLGKLLPLGYVRVRSKKGRVHYVAYTMAEVTHLDTFVPSPESDKRFECGTDDRDLRLPFLLGHDNPTWRQRCYNALLKEALKRRAERA